MALGLGEVIGIVVGVSVVIGVVWGFASSKDDDDDFDFTSSTGPVDEDPVNFGGRRIKRKKTNKSKNLKHRKTKRHSK